MMVVGTVVVPGVPCHIAGGASGVVYEDAVVTFVMGCSLFFSFTVVVVTYAFPGLPVGCLGVGGRGRRLLDTVLFTGDPGASLLGGVGIGTVRGIGEDMCLTAL